MDIKIKDIAYKQGWIIESTNPLNLCCSDLANPLFRLEIERYYEQVATIKSIEATSFKKLYEDMYANSISVDADIYNKDLLDLVTSLDTINEDEIENSDAPTIKYINRILQSAIEQQASDIHIEVFETTLNIRFRIDGILQDIVSTDSKISHLLLARIKIMAGLDVSEKRLPQDGRLSFVLDGESADVRISTLPTQKSERIVLRILKKDTQSLHIDMLGMSPYAKKVFAESLANTNGMVLVSGPTGAGKTTTLYAGVQSINTADKNIMTVEDPIEYNLDSINQTQVNTTIGMTFEKGLRAILRQDPDVILVGEIRDITTANIAVQSSLTGHLVLSTLHANCASSTLTRLLNIGVEPYLIASIVKMIIAQRLLRKLCDCKVPLKHDIVATNLLDLEKDDVIYTVAGCDKCNNTGYKGRIGIFEMVAMNDDLAKALLETTSEQTLSKHMQYISTLSSSAKQKILDGDTTIQEYYRVLGNNDNSDMDDSIADIAPLTDKADG